MRLLQFLLTLNQDGLLTRTPQGVCVYGAPMLMPSEASSVRHALDLWLEAQGVRPTVVGDFDDSALLKAFGRV